MPSTGVGWSWAAIKSGVYEQNCEKENQTTVHDVRIPIAWMQALSGKIAKPERLTLIIPGSSPTAGSDTSCRPRK